MIMSFGSWSDAGGSGSSGCPRYFIRDLTERGPSNVLLHEGQVVLRPPLVWRGGDAAAGAIIDRRIRLTLGPVRRRPVMPLELLETMRALAPQESVIVKRKLHRVAAHP